MKCPICREEINACRWWEIVEREVHPTEGSGGGLHIAGLIRFCSLDCIAKHATDKSNEDRHA